MLFKLHRLIYVYNYNLYILYKMIEVNQREMEEQKEEGVKVWKSCCLVVDRNMTVYLSQMIFATLILLFSCWQLIRYSDQCNIASPYYSLISFLMGKLLSNILTTK